MSHKIKLLFVFITIFTMAITALASNNNPIGSKVFQSKCAACHEGGNNTIEGEKTLKADALKKFGFKGVTDIKKRVENGAGVMPVFQSQLKTEEIEAVANYVWSQSQRGWK